MLVLIIIGANIAINLQLSLSSPIVLNVFRYIKLNAEGRYLEIRCEKNSALDFVSIRISSALSFSESMASMI